MLKRVVITGMGAVTPLGNSVDEFWKALIRGTSGVDFITKFDTKDHATKFAAEVKNLSTDGIIEPRELKRFDSFTVYALVAAQEAILDAGIDFEKEERDRIGVIVGSGIGGIKSFETEHSKILAKGPRRVSPFFIPQMIIDIASGHISMRYNLTGPNYSVVSACATATHSIGSALRTIQVGDADVMICGGAEASITPLGVAGFNVIKALSTRNDDPKTASRPFELNRDGFVIGEGSGILLIEELEHAKKRGAKIYAELLGLGFTADAYHITAPAPGGEGAARAMRACLKSAGLKPEEVDYLNAHGTSTPPNDKNETIAIKNVFGEHAKKMRISSTKSMTGHLLGATGAVELIASILAIRDGVVPPTINYFDPDPECDLNYTPNVPVEKKLRTAMSNTFGFGGHNAVLLVSALK